MKTILSLCIFFSATILIAQPLQLITGHKYDIEKTKLFRNSEQTTLGLTFSGTLQIGNETYDAGENTQVLLLNHDTENDPQVFGTIQGDSNVVLTVGHYYENNLYQLFEFDAPVDISMSDNPYLVIPETNLETRAICKYDENGDALWAGKLLNSETTTHQIQGTEQGVLVSGVVAEAVVYISPSGNMLVDSSSLDYAAYLLHLDQNGEVIWHQTYPYFSFVFTNALTYAHDKIYFGIDAIVAGEFFQLDINGDSLFHYSFTNTSIKDIQVDLDQSIYMTGHYLSGNGPDWDVSAGEYFAPGIDSYEMMLVKYDQQMALQWHVPIMGGNIDTGTSICFGGDDDIYVTGCIQQNADFDPTQNLHVLNAWGFEDAFVANYSKDGTFKFADHFGGSSGDIGFDIHYTDGILEIFGIFSNTMNVDLMGGTFNLVDENETLGASYFYVTHRNCNDIDCLTNQEEIAITKTKSYPNPVSNWLTIESKKPITQLQIVNILGQVVLEHKQPNTSINVADLPNGNYFVKVYMENDEKLISMIKVD